MGEKMSIKTCYRCNNQAEKKVFSSFNDALFQVIEGEDYCSDCARIVANQTSEEKKDEGLIRQIILTTTNRVEGFSIKSYIGIESVEVVMGTGMFSEFESDLADFTGTRSSSFEKKLRQSKNAAVMRLKHKAYEMGGNAVVGIDIDYTEFTGNRIGVIVNGTIVSIVKDYENTEDELLAMI